jgi:hypothetical protein
MTLQLLGESAAPSTDKPTDWALIVLGGIFVMMAVTGLVIGTAENIRAMKPLPFVRSPAGRARRPSPARRMRTMARTMATSS